jgi:hypothetical protein
MRFEFFLSISTARWDNFVSAFSFNFGGVSYKQLIPIMRCRNNQVRSAERGFFHFGNMADGVLKVRNWHLELGQKPRHFIYSHGIAIFADIRPDCSEVFIYVKRRRS